MSRLQATRYLLPLTSILQVRGTVTFVGKQASKPATSYFNMKQRIQLGKQQQPLFQVQRKPRETDLRLLSQVKKSLSPR